MPEENEWSLLYPRGFVEESETLTFDRSYLSGLSADSLFTIVHEGLRFNPNQKHPLLFLTKNPRIIQYRLDVLDDILNHESLLAMLVKLLPELEDMRELYVMDKGGAEDATSALYSVSEIELYLDCLGKLYAFFQQDRLSWQSEGWNLFAEEVRREYESEEFQRLREETGKLASSIRNIKSITIGINLDAQLKPVEAGIVSVNTEPFKSGTIMDRLLRAEFSKDDYQCLAPLEAVGKGLSREQLDRFRGAVNSSLSGILNSSVKKWRPAIRHYTKSKSSFLLRLIPEIRFLLGGVALLKKLQNAGMPLCKPQIADPGARKFTVKGLYNPILVLQQDSSELVSPADAIVRNDLEFDENGMIYLLTGPNSGGKSVFTQSVGLAQLMVQLGWFVPAFSAVISPVDGIYTHFMNDHDYSSEGRFDEECRRLMHIMERLSRNSLLLMDETFSGTSASEAAYIAEQVLMGLMEVGNRTIFSTHLHDLALKIDELNRNSPSGSSRIDSLTAGLAAGSPHQGKRSYLIRRARPTGSSYARDIAEKYGLSYTSLMSSLKMRKSV